MNRRSLRADPSTARLHAGQIRGTRLRAISIAVIMCGWLSYAAAVQAAPPPPSKLTDEACGAALAVGSPPAELATAVARFEKADRTAGPGAFDAARAALAAVPASDPVVALYVRLLDSTARVRYLMDRATLDRVYADLGTLDRASLCRLRAMLEHEALGIRMMGLFAYDPITLVQMSREADGRAQLQTMLGVFARMGDVLHRIGARRHFFALTYDFVEAFEPGRTPLPAELAKRVSKVMTAFGRQHGELFNDLPSSGKHTSE